MQYFYFVLELFICISKAFYFSTGVKTDLFKIQDNTQVKDDTSKNFDNLQVNSLV